MDTDYSITYSFKNKQSHSMPDSIVRSLTLGLNPEQLRAVTSQHDGPVLVLAGAGCGKTSVLTRRIAFFVHMLGDQDRILALTFTRKAAEEMADRVKTLEGIDLSKSLPTITTFHGFGLKVLKDTISDKSNFERLGYKTSPEIIPEDRRLKILTEVSSRDERRALGVDLFKLDSMLSQLNVHPEKLSDFSPQKISLLKEIDEKFTQIKLRDNTWEFSDMIRKTLHLFLKYPETAEHYRSHYKAILIDEFQDTNPLQIKLLNNLYSKNNSLFAVGDDDQAIYGFRGADIEPIMNFDNHFPGSKTYKLQVNYRSIPSVLNAANRIFKDKPQHLQKVLKSGKYSAEENEKYPKPIKKEFCAQEEMVSWIKNKSHTFEKQYKIPVAEMVLLFRLNRTLDWANEYWKSLVGSNGSAPQFLTIHGSKGLEFPVVFLCDLEEGVFPSYRIRKSQKIRTWKDVFKRYVLQKKPFPVECDFDEERRLFYVGVTRAEKILYLLSCKEKFEHGRKKRFENSRFLKLI